MEFRVLGPLEILDGGRRLEVTAPKQRALLCLLLMSPGRTVTTDRILDDLWRGEPPSGGLKTLHYYVSKLRDALQPDRRSGEEGVLVRRPGGYALDLRPEQVDAGQFEALVRDGRRMLESDPRHAAAVLEDALALWRGRAFEDFLDEPFTQSEIQRLEEMRLTAIEDRIEADLAVGRHALLIGELEKLTAEHALRERLWGQLMVALYRSDRQAEALRVYRRLESQLLDELGIDPSPDLQELEGRILEQADDLRATPAQAKPQGLRGFQLRSRLGEGAFGVVWQADQPSIGREVAIKAIRPEYSNRPEFVRSFEAEARLIASLEHPHIVPVFDFWRDPEGAYLVMRLMAGSLSDRVKARSWTTDHALHAVEQIGSALAYAHRRGLTHGDLHPGNVLMDSDGNSYLSDFGLAAHPAVAVTTPPEAYSSPEQRSGGSAGSASDVYGLARLTYFMLAGTNPPEGTLPEVALADATVSLNVDRVLRRATSDEVALRPPDADAFMTDLRTAFGGDAETEVGHPRNPYKGLRSFEETDAPDFFGRETLVGEVIDVLGAHNLVAVVGPSGSGKSSLVAAGMIPALRSGRLPGSEDWLVTVMRPGSDPFVALSEALRSVAVDPGTALRDGLSNSSSLPRLVEEALPPAAHLVLVIDQFEELFTTPAADSERFMDILCGLAAGPIRLVLVIRADYYGMPLQHERLGSLMRRAVISVAPPGIGDLERIIRRPAEQVGVRVDPEVVTAIVEDAGTQPGSLPLIEYALTRSFDAREGGSLGLDSYRASGGVAGALGGWPEQIVSDYPVDKREAMRRVFLHLVGVDDAGTVTRRRTPLPEMYELGVAADSVDEILADFGDARLLTFDKDPESRVPTVEIAHEELLRRWSRLSGWIDERREALVLQRRFRAAYAEWNQSGRQDGFLLSGGRLRQYESWAASADLGLTESERDFLRQGRGREDAEQSRRRFRRRALAGVLSALTVAAVAFALVAQTQRTRAEEQQQVADQQAQLAAGAADRAEQAALAAEEQRIRAEGEQARAEAQEALAVASSAEAETQARLAQARRLASSAVLTLESNPELSTLLAIEAVETTRAVDGSVLPEAVEALHEAVAANRLISRAPVEMYGRSVTYAPDGEVFYVAGFFGSDVVRVPDGEVIGELPFAIADATLAGPDGEWLAVADFDGGLAIRDREAFEEVFRLEGHSFWIRDVDASDDGLTLASAQPGDQVRVWDLSSRSQIAGFECDPADCPGQIWLSGDGTQVAFGSAVYDVATGAVAESWPGFGNVFEVLETAGVVVMVDEDTVNLVDRQTGGLLGSISEHTAPVLSVDASTDGRYLATGGRDGTAYVWDLSGGTVRKVATLGGHQGPVWVVRLSPDGRHAATIGGFQEFPADVVNSWPEHWEVRQWDIGSAGRGEWMAASGIAGGVFGTGGSDVVAALRDGSVAFLDPAAVGEVPSFVSGLDEATSVVQLPGGGELVVGGAVADGTGRLVILDAAGALMSEVGLPAESFVPRKLHLSDDGSRLAAVGDSGVHVWNTDGWSLVFTDDDPDTDRVYAAAAFSPDTSLLVTQSFPQQEPVSRMTVVWDLASGEAIIETGAFPSMNKGAAAFSPDGRLLVMGGIGRPKIFEPYTGRQLGTLDAPAANAISVAFSPDGSRIATGEGDGSVRLWDGATGEEQLVLRAHSAEVSSVAFSPDGSRLMSVDVEGGLLVWALDVDDLMGIARNRVLRDLTDVECRIWVGVDCPPPPDVQRLAPALAGSEAGIGIDASDWAAAEDGGSWAVLQEGIADLDTLVYDGASGAVVALDTACSWIVGAPRTGQCAPMPNLPEAEQFNPEPTIAGFVYHPGLDRIIVPRTDDGAVFTYDADAGLWEELSPAGGRFADRYGVGMVYDGESDLVVAFGGAEWGRIEDGKQFGLADTWTYDASLNEWVDAVPEVAPPGRVSHGIVYDSESDRVIVFGGADVFGGQVMGDTWAYDTNTNTWEEMTPDVSPPARAGHAMWYDPVADLVFVFGGSRDWTSWPYLPWDVFGGEELWAYDFNANTWTLMRTQSGPGYVADLVATFDESTGRAVVIGGASYDEQRRFRWELEDLWAYRHSE